MTWISQELPPCEVSPLGNGQLHYALFIQRAIELAVVEYAEVV